MKLLGWVPLPDDVPLTDIIAKAQVQARQQLKAEKFSTSLGGNPNTMQQNMLLAHEKGKAAHQVGLSKSACGFDSRHRGRLTSRPTQPF